MAETIKRTFQFSAKQGVQSFTINLDTSKMSQKSINDHIVNASPYEGEILHFAAQVLSGGDVFIDVGAHVGFLSLFAATLVGSNGRVMSFEPEPGNFQALQRNKADNGYDHITLYNAAVSNQTDTLRFWFNRDNDGGHALWNVGDHSFNTLSNAAPLIMDVTALVLKDCVADLGLETIKILKIDAEGAERMVLEGAAPLLSAKRIDFIVCEINEFALNKLGTSQDDLRRFMASFGYATFALPGKGGLPKLIPQGVTLRSQGVFNVLFTQPDRLAPYFPIETV